MKTISTMQFKGGAGKTTTLMSLASAVAARGQRVVIVDTDQNQPMSAWRRAGQANGMWNELVSIEHHLKFEEFYQSYSDHTDADDTDFLLVDTRGGRSEFILGVAQVSDLILLPVRPIKVDIDALLETVKMLKQLESEVDHIGDIQVVFAGVKPEKQQTKAMKALTEAISAAPQLRSRLHEKAAYQNAQSLGLIGSISEALKDSDNVLQRGQSLTYANALQEAQTVLDECIQRIDEVERAA